jgi:hypothetical protein
MATVDTHCSSVAMAGRSVQHPQAMLTRLVPEAPLPPYSYVSGRFPHPIRDPAGHSYGHSLREAAPLDPAHWQLSREYLLGCDLFNHGYYWEAHETWEGAWNACGRRGTEADFLKGLIKLAAAGVKVREGRAEGVARHGSRAGTLFRGVRQVVGGGRYLGLDLDTLIGFADRLTRRPALPTDDEAAVEIVFSTRLVPAE